tara:strand:+ start:8366 stop:8500 length:135 start_codon:yes stop_codon:yes gene_type:complete
MQAYASYDIDADFKRYNDTNTYAINADIPYVNLQLNSLSVGVSF